MSYITQILFIDYFFWDLKDPFSVDMGLTIQLMGSYNIMWNFYFYFFPLSE